ncbi:MAG: hypothetical protein Q4C56_02095 [Peptococcaceae bacterium]|nr:hypothetical protein [Peptococcaceae bacterium]
MHIYSEHKRPIGATRQSPCGCMTEVVIQGEPWRTMMDNVLIDYALRPPFGEAHCYRIDRDDDAGRWLVKAKSALEDDLWVDIAEVKCDEENLPVLSLLRVRPKYAGRRRSSREKRQIH